MAAAGLWRAAGRGRAEDAFFLRMNPLWDALAGLAAGVLSGFGLGGGTLLILYMTWRGGLSQHAAQGISLLYFIPCAAGALAGHIRKGQAELRAAVPAVLGGLPAAALAAWCALALDGGILRKGFGAVIIAVGLREMISERA
ncbi:MAG: TSUP family transporter [Oscillospiraceae bacterium]|nr:TSUP family transporter [Oscillospiraceae bacterium]